MIVIVTDGFYEWRNPNDEEFGLERLKETIRQGRDSSAADLIVKLNEAVKNFSRGTKQEDDLTAVVLRRKTPITSRRAHRTEENQVVELTST